MGFIAQDALWVWETRALFDVTLEVCGIAIYSGYGKYSDPLKFFTFCYIAAIC